MTHQLNLEALPHELSELYPQIQGTLDFSLCCILAKKYFAQHNLANAISLVEKALQLVSSQPKDEVNIKEVVICSVFILTLVGQRGLRQEHFDRIQVLLNEASQCIRFHVPFHPILPTLKGFWYYLNEKPVYAQYYFRKALKRAPISAFATLGLALSHYKIGNFDQALEFFLRCTRFVNNGENMPVIILDYRLGIAMCHLEMKREKEALIILQNIKKQSPDCIEASLLISMLHLRQFQRLSGDDVPSLEERAISLLSVYDDVLGTHPLHPGMALLLSELHYQARNYEQSYSFAQASLGHEPQTHSFRKEAYFLIGKIFYSEGEFTEARRFLSQVLLLSKGHIPATIIMSLLDFQEGELEESLNRLKPIMSLKNTDGSLISVKNDISLKAFYVTIQARLSRSSNENSQQFDVVDLKKYTTLFNDCSTYQENLVVAAILEFTTACEQRREWAQASINLNSILKLYSNRYCSTASLVRLAKCANNAAIYHLLNESKLDKIEGLLEAALGYTEKANNQTSSMLTIILKYNSALAYEKFGQLDKAKAIYETINQEHPSYFNATLKLGLMAQSENDGQSALFHFQSVVESAKQKNLKSFVIKGLLLQGVLYHEMRSLTQARHSFKRVLADFDSDNIVALLYVGFNYLQLARQQADSTQKKNYYREATQYFRRIHSNHPTNPYPIAGIGCILSDQHDYNTALKIFKEIGGRVEYAVNMANLASCHFRLGNFEEASLMYGNAVNSCTSNKSSLIQCHARALYALGIQKKDRLNILKSIEELNKAIKLNPEEQTLKFNLGLAYQFFGQLVCDKEALDITEYRVERAISSVEKSKEIFQELQFFAMSNKTKYPPPLVDSRLGFCTTLLSKLELRLAEEKKKAALEKPSQIERFDSYNKPPSAQVPIQSTQDPSKETADSSEKAPDDQAVPETIDASENHDSKSPDLESPVKRPRRQIEDVESSSNSSPLTDYEEYDPADTTIPPPLSDNLVDHDLIGNKTEEPESTFPNESPTSKRKFDELDESDPLNSSKKVLTSAPAPEYDPSAPTINDADYDPDYSASYNPKIDPAS